METYERVLEALSDTTRRRILARLRERPRSVAEIAEGLPVSRPAVSQHLKVLRECGLVDFDTVGTRNLYRADPTGARYLREWLDDFWGIALERYADLARREAEDAAAERHEGKDET